MTDHNKDRIKELCEKAGIRKPFTFSSWIFMRAAGVDKLEAAPMIGISRRQLDRYERQVEKRLTKEERFKLIKHLFNYEYDERMEDDV